MQGRLRQHKGQGTGSSVAFATAHSCVARKPCSLQPAPCTLTPDPIPCRFTNCNGKQLCGTCVVKVLEGAEYTNSKSIDEANFLAKLPGNYRLSCCVNTYGDIIVETRPPTGKKLIEFM